MPLAAGTRIGSYDVVELIGVGGMGEVYRARDTRLGRDVALKVLPDEFAGSADRLMRFEREARMLAALNHANIAQIHGVEANALVMELVEGDDLATRLSHGALAQDEALAIARQLIDALEAAHEQGVIHRDLKPANIKVRPDGGVKVLDFGLAKAAESTSELPASIALNSPTMTSPTLTKMGVVLGSAAYMSPEQARGRVVDKRADIWAFGCVLFEMLAGRPPFVGESSTDVIAAAIKSAPDWAALPADISPVVRELIARCLEKEPRSRLRDIGDARWALNNLNADPTATAKGHGLRWLVAALAAAALVAAGTVATSLTWKNAPATRRVSITFPDTAPFLSGEAKPSLAYSPDGQRLIYQAVGPEGAQLWLRDLNAFAAQPIPGTGGGQQPFFSPDGKWIGFIAEGAVKKMPISLGPPTVVCAFLGVGIGGTWTDKDEIVFATRASKQGLWRVPAGGGTPVPLVAAGAWNPDALPGGDAVVVTTNNPDADQSTGDLTIAAVSLKDGTMKTLFNGGTFARYSPTGHLLYLRNNAIMAAPFDARTLTVGDSRVAVIDSVFMDQSLVTGAFAISRSGAVAYVPGDATAFKRSIIGLTDPAHAPIVSERREYREHTVSPDGRRIAAVELAWRDRIWVIDIARQVFTRLTTGRYLTESHPIWSPDGRRIAFRTVDERNAVHLYMANSDGSGTERELLEAAGEVRPETWTADGRSVIFTDRRRPTDPDLLMLDVDGPANIRPVLQTRFDETDAALSPDGRWLAYRSNRSGRQEIYVSPYPSLATPVQVSTRGGTTPVWSRNGRRLYFRERSNVMSVEFGPNGVAASSQPLTVTALRPGFESFFVDTMPDGRLSAIDGPSVTSTHELRLILNWFDELRQRVK